MFLYNIIDHSLKCAWVLTYPFPEIPLRDTLSKSPPWQSLLFVALWSVLSEFILLFHRAGYTMLVPLRRWELREGGSGFWSHTWIKRSELVFGDMYTFKSRSQKNPARLSLGLQGIFSLLYLSSLLCLKVFLQPYPGSFPCFEGHRSWCPPPCNTQPVRRKGFAWTCLLGDPCWWDTAWGKHVFPWGPWLLMHFTSWDRNKKKNKKNYCYVQT